MHNTIAVAMSGGVDSSVAAWLLRQEGWETAGVTLRLLPPLTIDQADLDGFVRVLEDVLRAN